MGVFLPTAIQGMQNKCVALTVYMIGQYHNYFYQLTKYKKILKISDMNSNRKFSRVIIFVSSYILSSFYQVRYINMYIHQGFRQVWYQGGVKATVSGVVEDLKFKISKASDPNWCFPDSAQLAVSVQLRQVNGQSQENTNFGRGLLKF